ncbi:MAG: 3-dehydro-L-gulonate 2-dehydrogenase [Candidatus Dadabacteria bacterium]
MNEVVIVTAADMESRFYDLLVKYGFHEPKARSCAEIFTSNSVDGVYTHGVNRFSKFIQYVSDGVINRNAEPVLKNRFGAIEQWDGNFGAGPLNAVHCTERAMELARSFGIGAITLSNNNHWMRGGYYGWQAAKKGFILIAWTNTIACMPAWQAIDHHLGNNPLVIAIPYKDSAIVLDMAMSQFSYGSLVSAKMKGETLPVPGGYDEMGKPSTNPAAVLDTERVIPAGFWKGAGMALLLDILTSVLSGGMSTAEITATGKEYSSQVFIALDPGHFSESSTINKIINRILEDYHKSKAFEAGKSVQHPGERVIKNRKKNLESGIPVPKKVWEKILSL